MLPNGTLNKDIINCLHFILYSVHCTVMILAFLNLENGSVVLLTASSWTFLKEV